MIKLNDAFSSNFSYLVTGDGVYPKVRLYGGLSNVAKKHLNATISIETSGEPKKHTPFHLYSYFMF